MRIIETGLLEKVTEMTLAWLKSLSSATRQGLICSLCSASEDARDELLMLVTSLVLRGQQPGEPSLDQRIVALRKLVSHMLTKNCERARRIDEYIKNIEYRAERMGKASTTPIVIGVLSQKGGVGRSTVALAVAAHLTKTRKTCLLELDFGGPTLYQYIAASTDRLNAMMRSRLERDRPFTWKEVESYIHESGSNLSVAVASPNWEEQILSTTQTGLYPFNASNEVDWIRRMVAALDSEGGYEVVVIDTAAELRDLSRSVANYLSAHNGDAILVATPCAPALGIITQYHRLIVPGRGAIVMNRVPSDLAVGTRQQLVDHIVNNRLKLSLFGEEEAGPIMLNALLSEPLGYTTIGVAPELERISRDRDLGAVLAEIETKPFGGLRRFVDEVILQQPPL